MVGIKGVGMTMLAQYLCARGAKVTGSDIAETFMTDEVLKRAGITVKQGFDPANIDLKADIYIHSSAYTETNNPEMAALVSQGKPKLSFAQALGQVFSDSYGIAVCGSHGKTTTTAWLGYVLKEAGKSPSVLVGGVVPQFEGSGLVGNSDLMVIEADEYQNKLKYYKAQAAVLNNIDYDHPDEFPDPDAYRKVFQDFVATLPARGFLVANYDDPRVRRLAGLSKAKIASYAINESADYIAYNIREQSGEQFFCLKLGVDPLIEEDEALDSRELGEFRISLAGRHNVYNALAVIAASIEMGLELSSVRSALAGFTGTARRLEVKGKYRGAIVIDDYAHHPTEIRCTLDAVRSLYPRNRLITVFHPHTYSRTKALLDDFAASFLEADEVVVLDIYGSARETQGGVHSLDLVKLINSRNENKSLARHIPTLQETAEYLRGQAGKGDVILLLGAGDVFRVWDMLNA